MATGTISTTTLILFLQTSRAYLTSATINTPTAWATSHYYIIDILSITKRTFTYKTVAASIIRSSITIRTKAQHLPMNAKICRTTLRTPTGRITMTAPIIIPPIRRFRISLLGQTRQFLETEHLGVYKQFRTLFLQFRRTAGWYRIHLTVAPPVCVAKGFYKFTFQRGTKHVTRKIPSPQLPEVLHALHHVAAIIH